MLIALSSFICCLSSPSHLRLLNGQAKVRYCHNAVAMFRGVTEVPTGHTYVQTIGTRDRARHTASRRICPHIHILCMPVCVPMSARPRSGSPHDDLHRSSRTLSSRSTAVIYIRRCANSWRKQHARCCSLDLDPGSGTNKREAAISQGRIRRSAREQESHTEEHERIRRITRGAYSMNISPKQQFQGRRHT